MPWSQDDRWIREAVERFERPLTLYAARLLAGDVERARDVVQDTFLRLWQTPAASVDGHLAPWLYRVCRNRALDVRRKESRMITTLEHGSDVRAADDSSAGARQGPEFDPTGESGQRAAPTVLATIESLPEKQQEALRLKFQGGLSYSEIAGVMDITVNHVGVLIHTAIKSLRERMVGSAAELHAQGMATIGARGGVSQSIRGEVLS